MCAKIQRCQSQTKFSGHVLLLDFYKLKAHMLDVLLQKGRKIKGKGIGSL